MTEPFIISSHVPEDPLLQDLHNLELRLRIQKRWVQRTEDEIAALKERIKND